MGSLCPDLLSETTSRKESRRIKAGVVIAEHGHKLHCSYLDRFHEARIAKVAIFLSFQDGSDLDVVFFRQGKLRGARLANCLECIRGIVAPF
jgi:hypothetical protein